MARWLPQTITKDKTCWIFLTCSQEKRHVEDIVLGVDCLRSIGVVDKDILIFSDQPERQVILSLYNITANVFHINEFTSTVASQVGYEHVVLVIGGHGAQSGLAGDKFHMAPQEVVETLRKMKGISAGVIVAGQCYAGIFNYLSVGETDPQFVVLGATNLNPSLSDKAELDVPTRIGGISAAKDLF